MNASFVWYETTTVTARWDQQSRRSRQPRSKHQPHQRPAGLAFDQPLEAGLLEHSRRADEQSDRARIARQVDRAGLDHTCAVLAGKGDAALDKAVADAPPARLDAYEEAGDRPDAR